MDNKTAVGLVKARGYVVPARFGKPLVRDEETLVKELAATRARGYGVAIEEGEPGTCAMARPILGRDGAAVGTVSVAGPSSRFTLERMKQIAPDLAATVNEIADLWPARRVMDFVSGNNAIRVASNA
jgi:DNA-binding IclR family transcriptional regulator